MRRFFQAMLGVGLSTMVAGAASATACSTADLSIAAKSCEGFYSGNLLNAAHIDQQKSALAEFGYDWNGNFNDVVKLSSLNGAKDIDFGKLLTGLTYIGIHYGNGKGGPGNGTAFYVLDAAQGLNRIHLNYNASSDVVLFVTGIPDHVTGVPEPASWATMITGFAFIGGVLRCRRAAARSVEALEA